jgi:hypothetical protein
MQGFRASSLALQLPLIAAGCTLTVACCLLWLAATSSAHLQQQREAAYGEALARQIATAVSDPLQRGDLLSVRASLQRFVDASLATAVLINDALGLPMAQTSPLQATSYRADIHVGDDLIGEVRLSLETPDLEGRQRFLLSLLALAIALSLLVFAITRWLAQRLAATLLALQSQLSLPDAEASDSGNELARLQHSVEQLPLDMLRGHAALPAATREFHDAAVLFVHLDSLARYVDQLNESNLHRYTRRLQQLLGAAAQCYRGELRVTRQFGVLITFAPQRGAGSEALRAASCARLIARITVALQQRTSLSLDMAMGLGHCELGPAQGDDIYPDLYLQAAIDELREVCLGAARYPLILVVDSLLRDRQLAAAAEVDFSGAAESEQRFGELLSLATEQEALLEHQAQLIVERIKPATSRRG